MIPKLEDPKYLRTLKKNLVGIDGICREFKQDWPIVISGGEGSGKSTLGLLISFILNPKKFNIKKQMAWTLVDFIKLSQKYRHDPYKVVFFDEAVRLCFSREFMQKANIILVKLFISNRSFQHFYLINIPNFFYLEKYLREWRIKTLTLTYIDWIRPNVRYFSFYSKKRYRAILMNPKARTAIIDPDMFMKRHKPNFVEQFKELQGKVWDEYMKQKERFQDELLRESIEEAIKLEEKRKLGFHDKMNSDDLFVWLSANFRWGRTKFMNFTIEEAAKKAIVAKKLMNDLVNRLIEEGYFYARGRRTYEIKDKGMALIEEG